MQQTNTADKIVEVALPLKRAIAILLLAFGVGAAQTSRPTFEVATVRVNRSGHNAIGGTGGVTRTGRADMTNITLRHLVEIAYDVQPFQVLGGPRWMSQQRYDIQARAAGPVSFEEGQLMLQSLLEERFRLKVRHVTREVQGYALRVNKGPSRLVKSAETAVSGFSVMKPGQMRSKAMSMSILARTLGYSVDAPVIDRTQLDGLHEIALDWAPDLADETRDGVSLFTALKEQLGLELKSEKIPMKAIAINGAERTPTEN